MLMTGRGGWITVRIMTVVSWIILVRLSMGEGVVVVCFVSVCAITCVIGYSRKVVLGHTGHIVGISLEIFDELLSLHIGRRARS